MSYSIAIVAATKEEAMSKLAEEFDKQVVAYQPMHARDREQALAAAGPFIDLLADDEASNIGVALNGWLSWSVAGEEPPITGASVTVCVSRVAKAA
jgi:hypothetical protein